MRIPGFLISYERNSKNTNHMMQTTYKYDKAHIIPNYEIQDGSLVLECQDYPEGIVCEVVGVLV